MDKSGLEWVPEVDVLGVKNVFLFLEVDVSDVTNRCLMWMFQVFTMGV